MADNTTIIKLQLAILADAPLPRSEDIKKPSLAERVEYAVDCVDCKMPNRAEALDFLRKVHNKLLQMPRTSIEMQNIIDKIKPVLGDFGTEHLPDEESNDEEY